MDAVVTFSVVIPTHNRLALLRDAVASVLRQKAADFEIVVFDNGSTDDLKGFVESLGNSRVRYHRSERFLSVTDSWNSAIDLSTGDYVVLLGDDDGLPPDYFLGMREIIAHFDAPDVLYTGIYQFVHPGVFPTEPGGYVEGLRNAFFFEGRTEPFVLPADEAQKAVVGSLTLRRNFTFNMQAFCFSKALLHRLRADGPVFRSTFPDYYLANVALAASRKTVVVPALMAVAGVSRKSFGFTLFNGLEEKGHAFLNSDLSSDPYFNAAKPFLLPGPRYDTNYIVTMVHVAAFLGDMAPAPVGYARYRRLQIYRILQERHGGFDFSQPVDVALWSQLTLAEKLWAKLIGAALSWSRRLALGKSTLRHLLWRSIGPYAYTPPSNRLYTGQHPTLPDLLHTLERAAHPEESLRRPAATQLDPQTALAPVSDRIALVYLARKAEGLEPLRRFVSAYRHNPGAIQHEFVVVYKGFSGGSDLSAARAEFDGVRHRGIEVTDDGFDINAYLAAARQLDHDLVCFLNTFSEPLCPTWLALLHRHASRPGVGIAGATGSFESLYDSFALINKVLWLCREHNIPFDRRVADYYSFIVGPHCKNWHAANSRGLRAFTARRVDKHLASAWRSLRGMSKSTSTGACDSGDDTLDARFAAMWQLQTSSQGAWAAYSRFPAFPNPHIRSNGFMVNRSLLLSLSFPSIESKYDACFFESGKDSLTSQLLRRKLAAIVVDRAGNGYDVPAWVRSGTHRLGVQSGLLLSDNQTRSFDAMSAGAKATHVRMTWGDYLCDAPPDFPDFGFPFSVCRDVVDPERGGP